MTEKTKKAAANATVVYCGPTVRGVAQQYTIFRGGTPQAVQDFVKKYPLATGLVVPLERFAEVRCHLEAGTGAESVLLRGLKQQIKEG